MDEDGFVLVALNGKSRNRRRIFKRSIGNECGRMDVCFGTTGRDLSTLEELEARMERLKKSLSPSFLNSTLNDLRRILGRRKLTRIRAYGIGNFAYYLPSAYQMLLMKHIKDELRVQFASSQDPITTESEKAYLRRCGFEVLPADLCLSEAPETKSEECTLLFMVHCEHHLYNNILSTYWQTKLANIILLGNTLANTVCNSPPASLTELPALCAFSAICKSSKVRFEQDTTAFADTSIQFVDNVKLLSANFVVNNGNR